MTVDLELVRGVWHGNRHPGSVSLTPAQQVSVRLTSYWPELSALLDEKVLPLLPDTTLNLLGCDLRICGWTDDAARHPWAGRTTYADLVRRCTLDIPPPRTMTIDFASPTVFRSSGVNVPLPLPGLVFEGLARRWNLYAPLTVPPEVRRFGDEAMLISRYRLWTERVAFGGSAGDDGAYPGFLGQCSYGFRSHDRYWLGLVYLLSAFAFYAGVGARTSMGLGQARLLERRSAA